jgi:hypothetical protein
MEHVFSNVLQFLIGGKSRPCPDIGALIGLLQRHELHDELKNHGFGRRIVLDAAYATPRSHGAPTDFIAPQSLDAMCRRILSNKKEKHVFRTRRIFGKKKISTSTIGVVLYDNRFHVVSLRDGEVSGCLTTTRLDPG